LLGRKNLGTSCLFHVGHEDNVRAIMRHRAHTGGSDGLLVGGRPQSPWLGHVPALPGSLRARNSGYSAWAECVEHLTSRAARRLGLGRSRCVWCAKAPIADLVLFDPDTIRRRRPRSSGQDKPATGIHTVLVNGVPVLED